MKIKFDVTLKELIIVRDILEKYLDYNCKVWVFGSRAKSTSLFNSDLDLALECQSKINLKTMTQIKISFEDSRLPYSVDIVDINAIKPYFKEIITKDMILFPLNSLAKVPKLRFKEFLEDWEEKEYGEIYSFYSTNSFSRDNLNYNNGNIKNIHYGDIHTKFNTIFNIEKENVPYINKDINLSNIKEENYCLVGDLVVADASEDYMDIGKTIEIVKLNNEKMLSGLHTLLARPNKFNVALGYAGYLLQSWKVRKQVMIIAQGTKVLSLSTSRLSKIKLNLPSKKEQEKIASFLSSLDKKIEILDKKISLLQKYKKGLMQKIFSKELRFKANGGSNFPDWEEKRIGSLPIIISDGNYGEMYPSQKDFKKNGIPFLRANNIKNLRVNDCDMKYISFNKHKLLTSGHLETNDILITTRGDLGNIALVDKRFNNANINAQICLLRVSNSNIINYLYLLYVLDYRDSKKQYKMFETGTALKQLPKGNLRKITVPLLCVDEQNKIANFLSSFDKKIEFANKDLELTKKFKKALLQQMFI